MSAKLRTLVVGFNVVYLIVEWSLNVYDNNVWFYHTAVWKMAIFSYIAQTSRSFIIRILSLYVYSNGIH